MTYKHIKKIALSLSLALSLCIYIYMYIYIYIYIHVRPEYPEGPCGDVCKQLPLAAPHQDLNTPDGVKKKSCDY